MLPFNKSFKQLKFVALLFVFDLQYASGQTAHIIVFVTTVYGGKKKKLSSDISKEYARFVPALIYGPSYLHLSYPVSC